MFFILSKLLFFLLVPALWVIVLLVWWYFSKKPVVRKRLKIAVFVIVLVFSNHFLYKELVLRWQPVPVNIPTTQTYEAAIVLGGLSGYDKDHHGYFGANADRFIQTANLYHEGVVKKIIISGGSGLLDRSVPAESIFLRKEFIRNGIPDSAIICENESRNTYENAVYSKRIIDSLHIQQPVVLVTSALHMRRSEHVFRKAGIGFIAYPCDYKVTPEKFSVFSLLPDLGVFVNWTFFLKEMVGLTVYKLTGKA